jgi:hypothetical protein
MAIIVVVLVVTRPSLSWTPGVVVMVMLVVTWWW